MVFVNEEDPVPVRVICSFNSGGASGTCNRTYRGISFDTSGKGKQGQGQEQERSKQERGPMISGTRTREGEKIADAKKIRKPKGTLEFGKASQRPEKGQVTD